MKTIARQYHETRRQIQSCKPHSERRAILRRKLADLLTRQLKIEVRNRVPNNSSQENADGRTGRP